MRVYNWHIYKLEPTKNSLYTQSKIHLSVYLHSNSYKVNTKLILITLVQYTCDTCTETYTNIFKTKEVFFNQNIKGNFFQLKYQFIIFCKYTARLILMVLFSLVSYVYAPGIQPKFQILISKVTVLVTLLFSH